MFGLYRQQRGRRLTRRRAPSSTSGGLQFRNAAWFSLLGFYFNTERPRMLLPTPLKPDFPLCAWTVVRCDGEGIRLLLALVCCPPALEALEQITIPFVMFENEPMKAWLALLFDCYSVKGVLGFFFFFIPYQPKSRQGCGGSVA